MKYILFVAGFCCLFSCKHKQEETIDVTPKPTYPQIDSSKYPEDLLKVFTAHGGIQKWSEMRSMTYTMGDETHTTDLKTRDIIIESENYSIGSHTGKVWIAQDSSYFPQQRARFYHNLMFYFYAMPFILGDDGILYNKVASLEKEDISYPGIKISYQDNIGDSPDDEYILYYHPENYEMQWLAYTVTYGKNKKSTNYSYIHYNKWQEVNELLVPHELTWYNVLDGEPTVTRGEPRVFSKVDLDRATMDHTMYAKPAHGIYVD